MSSLTVTTAPTIEAVDLAAAAEWLRLGDIEDVQDIEPNIGGLLKAARITVENVTNRTLCTTVLKLTLDGWPACGVIRLPRSPVASVGSVKYYDTTGTQQTLSSSAYQADLLSAPARIEPAYGYVWPSLYSRMNAVEVNYTAGATSPLLVSDTIKVCIKMLMASWYENREAVAVDSEARTIPMHIQQLLVNETIPHFEW